MLLGLVRPTAGAAWLLDSPMPEAALAVLPRVGALVEGPSFQPYLSGRDNLARLEAVDATADPRTADRRAGEALERVGELDPTALFDAITTAVPEGRLISSDLFSVLITDDGRLLLGAVSPQTLQGLA